MSISSIQAADNLPYQLDQFKVLASRVGIELPAPIIQMFNLGLVSNDNALLSDHLKMNWMRADEANLLVDTWLNAELQHGKRFLPFATDGGGDIYCLVALPGGEQGVVFIYDNGEDVRIDCLTFPDFIYSWLLSIFADFRLIGNWDEISNPAPLVNELQGTVEQLKDVLQPYQYEKLMALLQREPEPRTLSYKHPEQTISLLALEEQAALLLNVELNVPVKFEIVKACDCYEVPLD